MKYYCSILLQNLQFVLFFVFPESQKTDSDRVRESLLLKELVNVVNQRDELVTHLDDQEKA